MEGSVSSLDGSITSAPELQCWDIESLDELKHLLRCTSLELESTRAAAKAQEQAYRTRLRHLECLLESTQRERDEAVQRLGMTAPVVAGAAEDIALPQWEDVCSFLLEEEADEQCLMLEPNNSSSTNNPILPLQQQQQSAPIILEETAAATAGAVAAATSEGDGMSEETMRMMLRSLPERGKLLQAVMQAGPLLQTLMLAGPLPQWHHPPPAMDSFLIPQPRCASFISSSTCL